jgi:hypothetical protein
MKRAARFLVRLYPARWRARYGDELEALIEDSPASGWNLLNVLSGAIRMQLLSWTLWKAAAILTVLGTVIGLGMSFALPQRWVVHIDSADGRRPPKPLQIDISNLRATVVKPPGRLAPWNPDSRQKLPRPLAFVSNKSGALQVEVSASTRRDARRVAVELPGRMIFFEHPKMPGGMIGMPIPDSATASVLRLGPSRPLLSGIGFAAGLLLASLVSVAQARWRQRG